MVRVQTPTSWYSQNRAGSVPGLLGLELRNVELAPFPPHPAGSGAHAWWGWGPHVGATASTAWQATGFLGLASSSRPGRREGRGAGRGPSPGVRPASGGQKRPCRWWPQRRGFRDTFGGWGSAGFSHLAGRGAGRERGGLDSTGLWGRHAEGPAWGRGGARAGLGGAGLQEASYLPQGAVAGQEWALARASCPGEGTPRGPRAQCPAQ